MRRRRAEIAVFGLSFLDVVSCGFGAAVLLFMLVDHARIDRDLDHNSELVARVDTLENQILDGRQELLDLEAALRNDQDARQTADAEAQRLRQRLESLRAAMPQAEDAASQRQAERQQLEAELLALEQRVAQMRAAAADAAANATRTVQGEGQRQYLTGLRVDGRRVLILVDASASMLGDTIVDAVRRRNMSPARMREAPKWKRTLATVDWITAQLPADGQFQMLVFAEDTRPVTGRGGWLAADGGRGLDAAMGALRQVAPAGGTSLAKAFEAARALQPAPDNILLLTDGLPTQGATIRPGTVSGKQRLAHFNEAAQRLPRGVPVNVILLPMEGDPRAASAFWQLARMSGGAFLEPSRDWP